jgi:putative transposase
MAVDQNMEHVRGAPYHPTTQGKIERHQPLMNRILLENYFLPGANRCARDFASDYRSFRIDSSRNEGAATASLDGCRAAAKL